MSRVVVRTPAERAHGTLGYHVSRWLAGVIARCLMRLTVRGRENIPAGGVLLAVNHASLLDGPIVFGILRRPVTFLIKVEMFTGVPGWFLPRIGQIPVRRGGPEREPLFAALATLAEGGLVGIFPEGTRGVGGDIIQVRHGIAYLALRSGCSVLPVACVGTERVLPRGHTIPRLRRPVTVAFGQPRVVAALNTPATRQNIAAAAERIRLLLTEHVRASTAGHGSTAGHPAALAPAPTTLARPPRGPADRGEPDR